MVSLLGVQEALVRICPTCSESERRLYTTSMKRLSTHAGVEGGSGLLRQIFSERPLPCRDKNVEANVCVPRRCRRRSRLSRHASTEWVDPTRATSRS